MAVAARYAGTCPECGDLWSEGDLIASEGHSGLSERPTLATRHLPGPDCAPTD